MNSEATFSERAVLPLNSIAITSNFYSFSKTKVVFLGSMTYFLLPHVRGDKSLNSTHALISQNAHPPIS